VSGVLQAFYVGSVLAVGRLWYAHNGKPPFRKGLDMRDSIFKCILLTAAGAILLTTEAQAADIVKAQDLPITEVSVFKDGHAFVMHEGLVKVDENGEVQMEYLPRAVLGTFWIASMDAKAKVQSVTSGTRVITQSKTALGVSDLIEANIGKRIRVRDTSSNQVYEGVILAVPQQDTEELSRTSVPGSAPQLPLKGQILMLKVAEGIKVLPLASASLQEITFLDEPVRTLEREGFRNVMTVRLGKEYAGKSVRLAMAYVQLGVRWIPSYHIDIDGKGKAKVTLHGTVINELNDFNDARVHLVVGVPSFMFKDVVDPMSMQETIAQLGAAFSGNTSSQMSNFSNSAIMSQQVMPRMSEYRSDMGRAPETIDLGPEVKGANSNEDLFIFSVEHMSLKKGQRMVLGVASYELAYDDIYKLDLNFAPPKEAMRNLNNEQQIEMAKLMSGPKVKHMIRIKNTATQPITTAPAVIAKEGRVMGQGLATYTAVGGQCDIELTVAIDISASRSDTETGRTSNAIKINGNDFDKVDLAGKITLVNRKKQALEVEVTRSVLGKVGKAGQDGAITQLGPQDWGEVVTNLPQWWNWYSWPWWWYSTNSMGTIRWNVKIEPGQTAELNYEWSYYWRW
jgi:hypothetical protein